MKIKFNEKQVRSALLKSWSLDTAKQWLPEMPAAGQCNVTAVVVYDLFGGEILRTKVPGYEVDHYYNSIDGKAVDLTDKQFANSVSYDDEVATRIDAMGCVLDAEYLVLREALEHHLK